MISWEVLLMNLAAAMAIYALDLAWEEGPSWKHAMTCRRAKMILEDLYGPARNGVRLDGDVWD